MNIRFLATVVVGSTLFFASAARATSVRTGSSYGVASDTQSSAVGEQWLVPFPGSGFTTGDVLLQISSTSPYLGDPIQVTLDLSGTPFVTGTAAFGLINCAASVSEMDNLASSGAPCSLSTNNGAGCDLTGVTPVGNTITLPGSCDVAGATFYFDEADALSPTTGEFVGAFAAVSPVTSATAPEPGSLVLLGLGLISVAFFSMRRVQA